MTSSPARTGSRPARFDRRRQIDGKSAGSACALGLDELAEADRANALLGVWSSTEWSASASIIFIVDENRLKAQGVDVDLDKAVSEMLGPVHRALGSAKQSVQVSGTVRTLEATSAFDLFVAHRQVDLDALPTGAYVAKGSARSVV